MLKAITVLPVPSRSLIAMAVLGALSNWQLPVLAADPESLGVIEVESSTITTMDKSQSEVSTITVIDEEAIKVIDPKHLNEVLQSVPGITSDVRGGEVAEIHMRGVGQQEFMFEDTGVAIVIDGVPVRQNGGKLRINLEAVETIKVIKGSASYLYGNTARGGAIIIATKKAKPKDEYSVRVTAGSYGYRDVVGTLYQGKDNYALNLNVNARSTDGFHEESALETKSVNGKLRYYLNDHSDLTFAVDMTDKYEESIRGSVTGFSEALANPSGENDDTISFTKDNNVDLDKYFITYENAFSEDSNLLVTGYHYNDLFEFKSTPYDSDADGAEDSHGSANNEDIIQQGVKAEYRTKLASSALMLGMDVGTVRFNDYVEFIDDFTATVRGRTSYYFDGEMTDLNSDEDKRAFYAELKSPITDKLTTTLNVRQDTQEFDYTVRVIDYHERISDPLYDTWTDTTTDRTDSFTNNSYRAGLAYAMSEQATLFSNVSTGFRVPTIDQKYAGDFASKYENNPDLDVETSTNYEVGVRGKQPFADNHLAYELSLFQIDTKDIISYADGTYYRDSLNVGNVGDARNRGIELSLSSDHSRMVYFGLGYAYLNAVYTRHDPFIAQWDANGDTVIDENDLVDLEGNHLPRTPEHTMDVTVGFKATEKLTLLSELYMQSGYYADEENTVWAPEYHTVNLQARYTTMNDALEWYFKVDNVFDNHFFRTVYATADRDRDLDLDGEDASIFVDPGRVFYAGVKYTF